MPNSKEGGGGRPQSNKLKIPVEDSLSCPRMVTRFWGLIVAIGYIATGGSMMTKIEEKKCKISGIYMLALGIILILAECPCCLIAIQSNKKLLNFSEKYFPFWIKGILYILLMITPVALCFHWKTMLVSLTMIILAILYFFLTCLQGSKRYEKLRGAINYELNKGKEEVSVAYSALSHASATISAFQSAARQSQHSSKKQFNSRHHKPPPKTRSYSDSKNYKSII